MTRHVKLKHTKTRPEYAGYGCSQCGCPLLAMSWESDSGVYCSELCAEAHTLYLYDTREAREKKTMTTTTKSDSSGHGSRARRCTGPCNGLSAKHRELCVTTHGGAREGAGPKTLASKGKRAKSERVTVRFTADELAKLQRDADADECSVAELIAQRALAYK